MDAFGFAVSTAFLATAFTIFGIIGRIVDGVAGEIRYTIAPAMVDGVRAWGDELRDPGPKTRAGTAPDDDGADASGGGLGAGAGHRAPVVEVPVQVLPGRGWHLFGRLVHDLAMARRRPLARP